MHLLFPACSQDNQLAVSTYPQLLVNSHSDLYIHVHVHDYDFKGAIRYYIPPTFRLSVILLSVNVGLLVSLVSPDIMSGATATADVNLIHSLMSISAFLGDNWSLDRDSFWRSLVTPSKFVSNWLLVRVCWKHPANRISTPLSGHHTNLENTV